MLKLIYMEQSSITEAIKKVIPAVVSIVANKTLVQKGDGSQFWGFLEDENTPIEFSAPLKKEKVKVSGGSGFIVDSDGLILTNRHVIADPKAEYIVILNDGKKFPVKILDQDLINDVAVLKIDGSTDSTISPQAGFSQVPKDLPTVEFGDSLKLELGQAVIAIGNALGQFQNTVSAGIVSGLSRFITASSTISGESSKLRGLIQTDAAINPGNSGGPLIDIDGKVIGINAACVFGAENIGFALPINNAKKILEDIKQYGRIRQPFLGIRYLLVNSELQKKNNLPINYGAMVISEDLPGDLAIIPESPADRAGLKEFDIILECQKEKITEENPLDAVLQKFQVGKDIELKILREGKEKILKAKLEEKS